jgi:hypothetical protein
MFKQGDRVRYLPTNDIGTIAFFTYFCIKCKNKEDHTSKLGTFCCGIFEEYFCINWDTALFRKGGYPSDKFEKVYTIDDFEIGDEVELVSAICGLGGAQKGAKGKVLDKYFGSGILKIWFLNIVWNKNDPLVKIQANGGYFPKNFKPIKSKKQQQFKTGGKIELNQDWSHPPIIKQKGDKAIIINAPSRALEVTDKYIDVAFIDNAEKKLSEHTIQVKYFNLIEDSKKDFTCEQKPEKKEKLKVINNQGRTCCIKCKGPLKKVAGALDGSTFDVCPKCEY